MMIGDGSYSINIYYGSQDEELLNYINIQGFLTKVQLEYITKRGKTYKLLVFQETRIKDILLNAKIYGQASLNKRLPFNYKKWDKK